MVEVGELVALAREPVREVLLALGEDVDENAPAFSTAACVSLVLFRQIRTIGGSIDSELNALAVVPNRRAVDGRS